MINVGILGFAHGHCAPIVKQWLAHPEYGVAPAGGWDHDLERAKKNCEAFGISCFDSAQALQAYILG